MLTRTETFILTAGFMADYRDKLEIMYNHPIDAVDAAHWLAPSDITLGYIGGPEFKEGSDPFQNRGDRALKLEYLSFDEAYLAFFALLNPI